MNYFKFLLHLFILCNSTVVLCQNSERKTYDHEFFLNNSQCISTTIYFADESDLMVAILDENASVADKNKHHYYIGVSNKENIKFLSTLIKSDMLEEVYVFNDDNTDNGDYKDINSGKLISAKNIQLIFQFDLDSPCHNDSFFVLITNKKTAKKLLVQLSELFEENKGFQILTEYISKS